jgi:hypothetical protein
MSFRLPPHAALREESRTVLANSARARVQLVHDVGSVITIAPVKGGELCSVTRALYIAAELSQAAGTAWQTYFVSAPCCSLPVALVRRGRLRSCGKGGRRTYRLYDHLRCRRSGSCASSAHYRSPSHHLPSGAASATRTRSGASPPTSPSCRRYSRSSVLGIFGVRRFGLKPRSESCAKT